MATPRGGGIAIVITTLVAVTLLGVIGSVAWGTVWGLCGGGALVALVGLADDRRHVPPLYRLVGHFVAAAWILTWIGEPPQLVSSGGVIALGFGLAALYIVWLINLTNFMDGIDGIAGIEVVTVCLAGVLLYVVAVPGTASWTIPLVLGSSTFGFLLWNWPPAKIFMGDVGSGFLGLMVGALSIQAGQVLPALFWSWVILLGVFVVDTTMTLVRRAARRERIYEAHCSHAYQHAARRWGAHGPVTMAVGAINLGWLLPLALLVATGTLDGVVTVVIAYVPLVVASVWLVAEKSSPPN